MMNLKEPPHMDGYLMSEDLINVISSFCVCAIGYQRFKISFCYATVYLYALFNGSLTGLLILEYYEQPSPVIGRNSPVSILHWMKCKCAKITCRRRLSV